MKQFTISREILAGSSERGATMATAADLKYGQGYSRGARAAAPAADPAARQYVGSIESLRGGVVEWLRPCDCARYCSVFVGPSRVQGRVIASIVDPADGQRVRIQHARAESIAESPLAR